MLRKGQGIFTPTVFTTRICKHGHAERMLFFQNGYRQTLIVAIKVRKCGVVQKSKGNKVPWKTGMLMYLPVTSQPPISLQKQFYHLVTS